MDIEVNYAELTININCYIVTRSLEVNIMAYFMKLQYAATGEGARNYYVLSTVNTKEELYNKCIEDGIDSYFMQCAEFVHIDDLTENDLKFILSNIPKMHMVIQNKIYKKGTVWIRYDDYLNFS